MMPQPQPQAAGRVLDLNLDLLDRQVEDPDKGLICKVDDLQFELDPGGRPIVVAILVGPRALGPRLGGRLGQWAAAISQRLADDDQRGIPRIDFRHVTRIASAVSVARTAAELQVTPLEGWVDRHIIARIPGSRHASQ